MSASLVGSEMCIRDSTCLCAVKSALVPAHSVEDWRRAMARSPFGASGVVQRGPYLGGGVGCRGSLALPPGA
eukprot:13158720-Alexandrium_andersonii.AAC.1